MSVQWTKKVEIDVFNGQKFNIGNAYKIFADNSTYTGLLKKVTDDQLDFTTLNHDVFVSIGDILGGSVRIIEMSTYNKIDYKPGQVFKLISGMTICGERVFSNSLIIIDSILLGSGGKDYYNIVIKNKGQITRELSITKDNFIEIDKNSEKIRMTSNEWKNIQFD